MAPSGGVYEGQKYVVNHSEPAEVHRLCTSTSFILYIPFCYSDVVRNITTLNYVEKLPLMINRSCQDYER